MVVMGGLLPKVQGLQSVGLEESQRASFSVASADSAPGGIIYSAFSPLGIPQEAENKALALELEILHPLTRTAGIVGLQM